ncbi:MAG: PAS domain S-box protein [Desulfatirhabdiaceae bacterium]
MTLSKNPAHVEFDQRIQEPEVAESDCRRTEKTLLEALREERDRAFQCLDIAGTMILGLDTAGVVSFVNKKGCQILAKNENEIIGVNWFDNFIPKRIRHEKRECFNRIINGEIETFEHAYGYVILASGKTEKRMSWHNALLKDSHGNIIGTLSSGEDITERSRMEDELAQYREHLEKMVDQRTAELQREITGHKQTEDKLRRIAERLELAQQVARAGVWEWDIEMDRIEWSAQMFDLFGPDSMKDTVSIESWKSRLHPHDRDMFCSQITCALKEQTPLSCDYRIELSDGRIRWLNIVGQCKYDKQGHPVRMTGICMDISDRKKKEELIQDSEQRFRAAFMGNPVAACITTFQDGVWIDSNQAELDLFGYTSEKIIGKSALEMNLWVDPADRQRIVFALDRGEQVRSQVVSLRRRDGGLILGSVSATALTLEDGVKQILFVTEDITERKQADERIKAALQEKEVLLREVHHRVKNNMQVISSLLYLQAMRPGNEPAQHALFESQQRVIAMAMVHEVLYNNQNMAAIDLSDYLKRLVNQLQAVYRNRADIRIAMEADKIEVDISQAMPCSLILNELITNAFKHAFPDGRNGTVQITLSLIRDRDVVLAVSDNGVGFTLDQDPSNPVSLGLKLVQRLAKRQLKGNLELTTEGGTSVTLSWRLPDRKGQNS